MANVASIILDQLGGNRFIAMVGAKHLIDLKNGLQIRIGRNSKCINNVRIILNENDLYNMEFGTMKTVEYKLKESYTDVGYEDLQHIFTEATGMQTSL